ncbi:hypothetical protein [Paraburkholderia hospita]|uniref:hypothetical protein n=1 Tax=Paraburkholderia hospita TaxID=169430 RepID=UPI0011776342|nr:hypothetical protein [Paraburkholderia hospita]
MICWLVSGFDLFLSATLGRVFLVLRGHSGAVFFLLRKLFGFLGFALAFAICLRGAGGLVVLALPLASAYCLRASSVAPVRGGTYFSLPPQRKVGKRKRLTPPIILPA